jgi:glycosyltransferase involved in cell wall biosynthesis
LKIGVVIVTFNRPELLQRALDSLTNQIYQDWVAVVVNNGSSPIKEFEDNRIINIESGGNLGSNRGRNIGLDRIFKENPDYLTLIDDDDFLEKSAFSEVVKVILDTKQEWLISNCLQIDEKLEESRNPIIKNEEFDYIDDYLYGDRISGDRFHMIKSSIIKNIRFDETVFNGEEWLFFIKIAKKYKMYGYPQAPRYISYLEGGLTLESRKKKNKTIQKLILDTKKPILSFLYSPTNMKAFRRAIKTSLKLPFKILFSLIKI